MANPHDCHDRFVSGGTLGFALVHALFVSRFGSTESSGFQEMLKHEAAAKSFPLAISKFVRLVVSKAGLLLAVALCCDDGVRPTPENDRREGRGEPKRDQMHPRDAATHDWTS